MKEYIKTQKNINLIVISVMLVTVISKILSFAREIFLTYYYGATGISDAYLISQTIPGTIFQFVGNGLTTCFIPIFVGLLSKQGKDSANRFVNSVISVILIFSTGVIFAVWLSGDFAVKLFASGFTGQTLQYAVLFTRISVCSLYISTFTYVFTSFLQSYNEFTTVSLSAIPNSALVIVAIVLGAKVNILFLPIGTVVAIFIQLLFMLPKVKKCQFKLRPNFDFRSKPMMEMYHLLIPVIIGVSVNEINVLIDKTVASNVAVGGISSLTYAYSLIMFVQGIFAQTIATVYYPSITRYAKEQQSKEFNLSIDNAISSIMFFLLPITVGCILLAYTVVNVLYGRGAFESSAITMTAAALTGYAVGCVGYGLREILSRVFYSVNETKIPTRNAAIGMVLNIIMNLTLSRIIGISGLALATSVSSIITSLLLLYDLKNTGIYVLKKQMIIKILKMLGAAVGMGVVVWLVQVLLSGVNDYILLVASVVTGAIIYFALCLILKVDVLVNVMHKILKRQAHG